MKVRTWVDFDPYISNPTRPHPRNGPGGHFGGHFENGGHNLIIFLFCFVVDRFGLVIALEVCL